MIRFEVVADTAAELQKALSDIVSQTGGEPEVAATPPAASPAPASLEDLIAELEKALGKGYKVVVMSDDDHAAWENSKKATPAPADEPSAVPAAKALADEHGVDLSQITGTGVNGRILKSDVQGYLDSQIEQGSEPEAPPEPAEDPEDPEDPAMSDADKLARAKMVWAHIYGSGEEGAKATLAALQELGVKKFHEVDPSHAGALLAKGNHVLKELGLEPPPE